VPGICKWREPSLSRFKGFFTFELLASVLILLVVLAVCVNAFMLKARGIVFEKDAADGKLQAILKADSLLKKCAADRGLAECRVFLHSHEVVELPVEEGGYCVSRAVVFQGEPRIMQVCVK
jgi:hypothetical protein